MHTHKHKHVHVHMHAYMPAFTPSAWRRARLATIGSRLCGLQPISRLTKLPVSGSTAAASPCLSASACPPAVSSAHRQFRQPTGSAQISAQGSA